MQTNEINYKNQFKIKKKEMKKKYKLLLRLHEQQSI